MKLLATIGDLKKLVGGFWWIKKPRVETFYRKAAGELNQIYLS